jgi:hypothetical protein
MKQIEPCQVASQTFTRIFRKHVHLLVAMGYEATRESLHAGLGEEKITDCLAHAPLANGQETHAGLYFCPILV